MFNHKARSRKGVSEEIGITQTEINPHASDLSEYFVNHVIWVSIDIILSFFSVCFLITWMFKRKWSVYIYGYE